MFRTRRIIYQGTSCSRERPKDGQRLRKARSNDRWAADLATVASVEEAAASWKRSWEGGNRWKLQRTIDFSGGEDYRGQSVRGTKGKAPLGSGIIFREFDMVHSFGCYGISRANCAESTVGGGAGRFRSAIDRSTPARGLKYSPQPRPESRRKSGRRFITMH